MNIKQLVKQRKRVLSAMLMALGFYSCKNGGGDTICLYGCPTVDFHVVGQVTDEGGNPISGINVKAARAYGDQYDSLDSVFTDSKGQFKTGTMHDVEIGENLTVIFEDVDGSADGGAFASDTLDFDQLKITKVADGDGKWMMGTYEIEANAKLKKK